MRKKIEFMADRIEAVLSLHKVPARVEGGTLTPRWIRFQVLPVAGAKISRIKGLSEELAAALDVQGNIRISRRGAAISIEVPRDDPQTLHFMHLMDQLQDEYGGNAFCHTQALLGLADDGAPLLIRIASPDVAHIMIAGNTGAGKTVLMKSILCSMAMTHRPPPPTPDNQPSLGIILIDPKGNVFNQFSTLPHLVRPLITDYHEATECLQSLVRLMERHAQPPAPDARSCAPTISPTIIVFIDELADYLMVEGDQAQWALTRLTQRGREAGIHIVAATQKPTAAVLGPLVKANFPVRLVGRVVTIEDARTATGWAGTGAERLMGQGDFLAIAEGRMIRFQVAHLDDEEIVHIVTALANGGWQEPHTDTSKLTAAWFRIREMAAWLTASNRPQAKTVDPGPRPASAAPAPTHTAPTIILPPPPPPPPDATDILVQRLRDLQWNPDQSVRAACNALGMSPGGAPFKQVQQALTRLRAEQPAQAQVEQPARRYARSGWMVYERPAPRPDAVTLDKATTTDDDDLAQAIMGEDIPQADDDRLAQAIMDEDIPQADDDGEADDNDPDEGQGDGGEGQGDDDGEAGAPAGGEPSATATATATATEIKHPSAPPTATPPPFDSSRGSSRTAPTLPELDAARLPPSLWMGRECLHHLHSPLTREWLTSLQRMLLATSDVLHFGTAMLSLSATAKQAHDDDHLEYLATAINTLRLNLQMTPIAREHAVDSFADVVDCMIIGMGR